MKKAGTLAGAGPCHVVPGGVPSEGQAVCRVCVLGSIAVPLEMARRPVQIRWRGSAATIAAAATPRIGARAGDRPATKATMAPIIQPVKNQRIAAVERFFMPEECDGHRRWINHSFGREVAAGSPSVMLSRTSRKVE